MKVKGWQGDHRDSWAVEHVQKHIQLSILILISILIIFIPITHHIHTKDHIHIHIRLSWGTTWTCWDWLIVLLFGVLSRPVKKQQQNEDCRLEPPALQNYRKQEIAKPSHLLENGKSKTFCLNSVGGIIIIIIIIIFVYIIIIIPTGKRLTRRAFARNDPGFDP